MFGPEPLFPQLSLAAALRDLKARSPRARANAIRALPDALAADCRGPEETEAPAVSQLGFARLEAHAQHSAALTGLRALDGDADGFVRGLAMIARGRLADVTLLGEYRRGTLAPRPQDPAKQWIKESAILGLGELAAFAPPPPGVEHDDILRALLEALDDPAPEVRFQAIAVVADAAPSMAGELLPPRLALETEAEVRAQIYATFLDRGDPPGVVVAAARAATGAGRDGDHESSAASERESFAAARLLASLRIADAAQRLLRGMSDGDERDDAIEAMAALEPSDIPEAATDLAERLTRRWLVPPVTRVRAAYLLARVRPDEGGALLDRMARSARASVRDAVVDARAALHTLSQR